MTLQAEAPRKLAGLWSGFASQFLGASPRWYKQAMVALLLLNALLLWLAGPVVTTWLLVFEFIFTLGMALKCYPLQPGGLLALQAVLLGLVSPEAVYTEVVHGFPVILLLIFMVAGIHFLREGLLFLFTGLLLRVRSQTVLALLFCVAGALLSAFLDALTVLAVVITVAVGFHELYHRAASGRTLDLDHDPRTEADRIEFHRADLEQFRAFCATHEVTHLSAEEGARLDYERMKWRYGQPGAD